MASFYSLRMPCDILFLNPTFDTYRADTGTNGLPLTRFFVSSMTENAIRGKRDHDRLD
jgi:hypothetical protein